MKALANASTSFARRVPHCTLWAIIRRLLLLQHSLRNKAEHSSRQDAGLGKTGGSVVAEASVDNKADKRPMMVCMHLYI